MSNTRTRIARSSGSDKMKPNAPALKLDPIIEMICKEIAMGSDAAGVKWRGRNEFDILPVEVIPRDGPAQTRAGRRKRLKQQLLPALGAAGWTFTRYGSRWRFTRANDT